MTEARPRDDDDCRRTRIGTSCHGNNVFATQQQVDSKSCTANLEDI